MTSKKNQAEQAAKLRQHSEELARREAVELPENLETMSPEAMRQALHELRVQLIELQLQNEDLRRARSFDPYDLAAVGYCNLSKQGLILSANFTAVTLLGVIQSTLLKQPLSRFVFKEDQNSYFLLIKRLFETGTPQTCELRMLRHDGMPHWVRFEAIAEKDESGAPMARVMLRDISQRKKAENELATNRIFLEILLDAIPIPIFYKDTDGRYLGFNKAFEDFYGKTISELVGKSVYDISPKHLADIYHAKDHEILNHPGVQVYESEVQIAAGAVRNVIFHKAQFKDPDGHVAGLIGVILDITDRTLLEQEKVKLKTQMLQSQKMAAIGQLASGIAHDFNNILGIITSFAYLLKKQFSGLPVASLYIAEIQQAADRASTLTQSLLAFSRKQHINPQPMDLNASIQKTAKLLDRTIGEDIHLSLQLTDANTSVHADSNQIAQILMNLAANARDAMPRGGTLTIRTVRCFIDEAFMQMHGYGSSGEYVIMTVQDSGMGMDEEIRQKIFEPFFTTKEAGKGTGLGLAMVYGIVTQQNGFVDVESQLGTGTTFKVYLPALEKWAESAEIDGNFEIEGMTETILVVEDEIHMRQALTHMLQSFGHTVMKACDGDDAVTQFLAHKDEIHLVLMDVIMPHKSGADAYLEIKAIRPNVKIILMSGYAGDYLSDKLSLEENVPFLSKPIDPKELFEKIRSVLEKI